MLSRADYSYYNKMIDRSKKVLDDLKIPYSKHISWGTFKRNRIWGRCYNNSNGITEIKITERLILARNDHSICDTIIHELLHSCKGCHGHKGKWLKYANIVNSKTDYHIKRLTSSEEKGIKREYKYKVVCDFCGGSSYFQRDTKFINQYGSGYRCKCGSQSWHAYKEDGSILWESHTIEDLLRKKK